MDVRDGPVCTLASTSLPSWKVRKERTTMIPIRNITEECKIVVPPEENKQLDAIPAPATPECVAPRRRKLNIRRKPMAPLEDLTRKPSEMEIERKNIIVYQRWTKLKEEDDVKKVEKKEFGILQNIKVYQRREKLKEQKSKARAKKKLTSSSSVSDSCEGPEEKVSEKKTEQVLVKRKSPRIRRAIKVQKHPKKRKIEKACDGMIVPYIGTSHLKPKTKSIAEVALDERTVKEWKILTGELDAPGIEDADEDEREWWEKERTSIYERVKSFVSSMHRIQGNKAFSQWKGSVMDSVVGAYLSQNVNDTLSSFAIMSLAAKYAHRAARENSSLENSLGSSTSHQHYEVASCSSTPKLENGKLVHEVRTNGTSKKRKATEVTSENINAEKSKREERKSEKNDTINWDNLKKLYAENDSKRRSLDTSDALDWEAVMTAEVDDISKAIEMRGMHNHLAARIKNCLDFLKAVLGSIDMEWIRNVPSLKTKEHLLSLPGLGLKSVECIRLLTLQQQAFPIDRNAGRVAVRLGWVPLLPLVHGEEFHLLQRYPHVNSIQKYLWPRLSTLDVSMLYELHCQIITFGKVFCTKRRPNCNACPMRAECLYYASSIARSQPALPGMRKCRQRKPKSVLIEEEEKAVKREIALVPFEEADCPEPVSILEPEEPVSEFFLSEFLQILENSGSSSIAQNEPLERDMEDFGLKEIPRITVDVEKMKENVHKFITERNITIQEGELCKALTILASETASKAFPEVKNAKYLRTEHQVYKLPDEHDLLKELDKREPDDECPYLLAIWPLENLDFVPDEDSVYGTLLIPARTAVGGRFPFNGTFFQANEVLADDESSKDPIKVPLGSIWDLPRSTVYCGNNISSICRGMQTYEVQKCFWRGYVCFRGFNRKTKEPKTLSPRLHLPLSKNPNKPKGRKKVQGNTSKNNG